MDLPTFPNFKVLTVADFAVLDDFLGAYAPYSDFNAVSMLCWNSGNDNSYTFLNGNLVIRLRDYLSSGYNYSILGSQDIDKSISLLLGIAGVLKFVPEIVVENIRDANSWDIALDRDSFDYVLLTASMANLSGRVYKNVRKHIRNFENKNASLEVREIDLLDASVLREIEILTRVWCSYKGFEEEKKLEDLQSVRCFCSLSHERNTISFGLYVDSVLIGFTLNELLEGGWAMGHFGHANNEIKYSSLYLEYVTSVLLSNIGVKYLNIQQDTGLAGLRESKSSYHPAFYLKKYTLSEHAD